MKKVFLLAFFCLLNWGEVFPQCSKTSPSELSPEFLYRYWQIRERFDKHFIKTDLDEDGNLLSDGIGTWDNANNSYTKAGYSLPAVQLKLATRDPVVGTNVHSPEDFGTILNIEGEVGTPNVMVFGADVTYTTGMYIAMLVSEYELLRRNNLNIEKQKTLNELFLALQAVRRLDMTANRLANKLCTSCEGGGISSPDFSGYSGFLIRDDIPGGFHNEIDDDEGPDHWRVGGIKSQFGTEDFQTSILCNFRDEEYKNRIAGQDQIVSLLFGLSFVKKFIPENTVISYNNTNYDLLSMAQNIAFGMVNRINGNGLRRIMYPACQGEDEGPALTNQHGGDVITSFHGMKKVLDFIMPGNPISAENNALDFLAWQGAIYDNVIGPGITATNDNTRMFIELMTSGDTNYGFYSKLKAKRSGGLNLMQHFAWGILHDNEISTGDKNDMRSILCRNGCDGPCHKTTYIGPDFDCSNLRENGWSSGERWKHSYEVIWTGPLHGGMKTSGYDYMLGYNLYHLIATPNEPYFNPRKLVEQDVHEDVVDHIVGSDYICFGTIEDFILPDIPNLSYENITWRVSDNLNISNNSDPTSDEIGVYHTFGDQEGDAWIRVSFNKGPCEYFWQKNIWIGDPSFPVVTTDVNACGFLVELSVPPGGVQDFDWTINGPDEYVYVSSNEHNIIIHAITDQESLGPIDYSITVENPCNRFTTSGTVTIPACDSGEFPDIPIFPFISPNPAHNQIFIELQNASTSTFSEGGPITYYLIDQYSDVKKSIVTSNIIEQMDVSGIPNGIYYILAQNSMHNAVSSPFVIQH